MKYTNEKLGLYGYDLSDNDDILFLESKGLVIDVLISEIVKKKYQSSISGYINSVAVDNGYDSAISFATYANGSGHYAIEAQKFVEFRSQVWDYAFSEFEKFSSGDIVLPSLDYFLSTLPKFDKAL